MPFFSKKQKNKAIQKSWQGKRTNLNSSSERKYKSKSRKKFSRFLFWLLFLVFVGICAYILLFSPFLDIEKISVEGNQDVPSASIASAVEKALEGKYLRYFPERNFFVARETDINSAIRNNFSQLEVTSVEKRFPGSVLIRVTERKPEIVWCSGGVCYFLDKSGLAYSAASAGEEDLRNSNFIVVVDESAIPIETGKSKISGDLVSYIEAVNTMLRDDLKIITSRSYHTPALASREIDVVTGEGWILKLSADYSVEEAKKTIQSLFEKDLNEDTRKNLDYLDLSVKGKIYYKTK